MPTPVACTRCRVEIPPDDVNVAEGVAYCRACNELFRLSDLLAEAELGVTGEGGVSPEGCRQLDDGVQTVVRASARSFGRTVVALLVAGFWNGIVSIFVLIALGGTLQHLLGSVPPWFPAPTFGSGSSSGMPLGIVLFMWVFLTPFIVAGVILVGVVLTSLFGRVEVRVRGISGVVLTGFGPFTWRRRFDASRTRTVRLGQTLWRKDEQPMPVIVIEADRIIRFGSILPDERRGWMLAALRRLLVPPA